MDQQKLISFVIIGLFCAGISARPGQLKVQKCEFPEFHSSSSQDQISSSSHDVRLPVAPIQHEVTPWAQQHPNEVNAFAEMFRQNYNQMVTQHNEMMQMHQHAMANMFIPVTYELYHVPVGYTWNSYFGNQLRYVQDATAQMSRQLIEDIGQGRRTQQELMDPNFFIDQAASELNRVHQSHQVMESEVAQDDHNMESSYQQQHQPIFVESAQQTEFENTEYVMVYNEQTKQYEYVKLLPSSAVPPHEEVAGSINTHRPSYIQSLPPVKFDNDQLNKFDQQIEQIEVHTPISVETPKPIQRNLNEQVFKSTVKPLIYQTTQINNEEFYGSTYDQQPKFDLQFVERQSTSATSSRGHIMSLVRNRTKVNVSTTTEKPTTTTTTTTTPLPTTTSGIMSMLPNKKPTMNYTDLYQQVQAELNKHMTQIAENNTEETHFMGMTSNSDHVKLTYETVNHGKDEKESRGDQGITKDDYIYDDSTELEPGMGHYSANTEPALLAQSTILPSTPAPDRLNPFYSAPLAPFPTKTTTFKPPNPYYSAPLAPFPEDMVRESSDAHVLQHAEYSEIADMTQQVQTMEHHHSSHFEEAHTYQDMHAQDEFNQGQFQISHGYTDMQQVEDEQQRYTDVGGFLDIGQSLQHPMEQKLERQLPPEQAYRNPDSRRTPVKDDHQEHEIPALVQEVVATPAPVHIQNPKKNWFQRQYDKVKSAF